MKTIDFVKKEIDNIVNGWIDTGLLPSMDEVINVDISTINDAYFSGIKPGFSSNYKWQKYYVENNKDIRKFLRGNLGSFEDYKDVAKFEKIYGDDDIIDGEISTIGEVSSALTRITDKLDVIISDTADYYAQSKALRPHLDSLENDRLFSQFSQVVESFIDHVDKTLGLCNELNESEDIKKMAKMADNLGTGLLYDFVVMSKYINKVLETVKK